MEELGMTDTQFKDFIRGIMADLEEIEEQGVSEQAAAKIDKLLERFRATLED